MKRGLLVVAIVCLCSLRASASGQQKPVSADSAPLSLPAYTNKIDHWTSALERLKHHPRDAAALRGQLPPNWTVILDRQQIKVPTGWLRDGLKRIEKDPGKTSKAAEILIAHLQAMKRESGNSGGSAEQTGASARKELQAILSMPEFRGVHGPTWFAHVLERIRKWLLKWLSRLNLNVGSHQGIANLLFWVILISGGGGLIAWMVQRLLMRRPSKREVKRALPETKVVHAWERMASQARKTAAAGEYRDAIRLAYWAAIHRLDELGLWAVDHTRTHREYLRLVRRDQPESAPLAALTRQFEMAWYAARSCSANDFELVITQLEKLGCA